jgi:hypothetical protein
VIYLTFSTITLLFTELNNLFDTPKCAAAMIARSIRKKSIYEYVKLARIMCIEYEIFKKITKN